MGDVATGTMCPRQDLGLPLAPGLLSFLASASDGIRTALHRPQVRRRRVNPRKYFQKQLHGCRMAAPLHRSLSRPSPSPSEGVTRPPTAVQRVTNGRAVEQKSLDALFDPRTVAATADLCRPAPLRRRRLPASFFTEPRASCESTHNPVESPGSAASNDSNYADSQGSCSDHVASPLDLDALLASPLWTDDDDSTPANSSPNNPGGVDNLCEYSEFPVATGQSHHSGNVSHSSVQITKETNDIFGAAQDIDSLGQQTDHFQSECQQYFPSCQYAKRYNTAINHSQRNLDEEQSIVGGYPTSASIMQLDNTIFQEYPLTDSTTGRYQPSELETDSVVMFCQQPDVSADAKLPPHCQHFEVEQRWLPPATPEVYSSILLSPFSNCSPIQSPETEYHSPITYASNKAVSSPTVSSATAPNNNQSKNTFHPSVCVSQVSDSSWTAGQPQEVTNSWQHYQLPSYESNTFYYYNSIQNPTDNQPAVFYGAC